MGKEAVWVILFLFLLSGLSSYSAEPIADQDSDEIDDIDDQCPGTENNTNVNFLRCSWEQLDSDGDGIQNGMDICPEYSEIYQISSTPCNGNQTNLILPKLDSGKTHGFVQGIKIPHWDSTSNEEQVIEFSPDGDFLAILTIPVHWKYQKFEIFNSDFELILTHKLQVKGTDGDLSKKTRMGVIEFTADSTAVFVSDGHTRIQKFTRLSETFLPEPISYWTPEGRNSSYELSVSQDGNTLAVGTWSYCDPPCYTRSSVNFLNLTSGGYEQSIDVEFLSAFNFDKTGEYFLYTPKYNVSENILRYRGKTIPDSDVVIHSPNTEYYALQNGEDVSVRWFTNDTEIAVIPGDTACIEFTPDSSRLMTCDLNFNEQRYTSDIASLHPSGSFVVSSRNYWQIQFYEIHSTTVVSVDPDTIHSSPPGCEPWKSCVPYKFLILGFDENNNGELDYFEISEPDSYLSDFEISILSIVILLLIPCFIFLHKPTLRNFTNTIRSVSPNAVGLERVERQREELGENASFELNTDSLTNILLAPFVLMYYCMAGILIALFYLIQIYLVLAVYALFIVFGGIFFVFIIPLIWLFG
jgi:hypothetical protein